MQEEIVVLGTGYAVATRCYNTCFAIRNSKGLMLVDGGGGNGILTQMRNAELDFSDIRALIITHEHCDHILGCVWVFRILATMMIKGKYEGRLQIYCHKELATKFITMCKMTLQKKLTDLIGSRIDIVPVMDGDEKLILGYPVTFFDIHSTKAKQFGFTFMTAEGKKITFLGDEPYNELCHRYAAVTDMLLCEAFCLFEDREIYKPYEKHHSTVRDACELAQRLHCRQVVLWHTEDDHYDNRQEIYMAEGRQYFKGQLFVPYDLERIPIADTKIESPLYEEKK